MFRNSYLLPILLILFPGAASAQEVRGKVSDVFTEQPIPSALVLLIGSDGGISAAVRSDPIGNFILPVADEDSVRVRVQQVGYGTVESISLAVSRAKPLQLEIRLRPRPVQLEGVTVTAPENGNLAAFLKRRESGFGVYLGPKEIAKIDPKTTSGLLFRMAGSMIRLSKSVRAIVAVSGGNPCIPRVYLDGWRLKGAESTGVASARDSGVSIDSFVPVYSLQAVEVYRNPQNAPAEFQEGLIADCPVIMLWTDHGFRDLDR